MPILQYYSYYQAGWKSRYSAELSQSRRDELTRRADLKVPEDFLLQMHKKSRKRFNYFILDGKKGCLVQTLHKPEISGSRREGSFSHALIFDLPGGFGHYPIELFDWAGWDSSIPESTEHPLALPLPLDPPIKSPLESFEDASGFDATVIAQIIQQVVKFLDGLQNPPVRILLKGDSYTDLATWLGLISLCFPSDLASRLTFSLGFPGSPPEEFICCMLKDEVDVFHDFYGQMNDEERTLCNNRMEFVADQVIHKGTLSVWGKFCKERLERRENDFLLDEFKDAHGIFRLIYGRGDRVKIGRALELSAQILSSQETKTALQAVATGSGISATEFRGFLVELQRMFWPSEMIDQDANPLGDLIRDAWLRSVTERITWGTVSYDELLVSFLHVISGWETVDLFVNYLPKKGEMGRVAAESLGQAFVTRLQRVDTFEDIFKVILQAVRLDVSAERILSDSEVAKMLSEKQAEEDFETHFEGQQFGSSENTEAARAFFPSSAEAESSLWSSARPRAADRAGFAGIGEELTAIYDLAAVGADYDRLVEFIDTTLDVYVERFCSRREVFDKNIPGHLVEKLVLRLGPERIIDADLASKVAFAITGGSGIDDQFKREFLPKFEPFLKGKTIKGKVKAQLRRIDESSAGAQADRRGKVSPESSTRPEFENPDFLTLASQERQGDELVSFFEKEVKARLPQRFSNDDRAWVESFFWAHWHVERFSGDPKFGQVQGGLLKALAKLRGKENIPRGRTRTRVERMLKKRFKADLDAVNSGG